MFCIIPFKADIYKAFEGELKEEDLAEEVGTEVSGGGKIRIDNEKKTMVVSGESIVCFFATHFDFYFLFNFVSY